MSLPRVQSKKSRGGDPAQPAVHVVTFGCQMNKYDSLLVEGRFQERGYRVTEAPEEADVILFNTCSVRDHAEERVYSWLGDLKRRKEEHPDLVVGVLGCMAQRAQDDIFGRATHVDVVCGTRQIANLPDMVDRIREERADQSGRRTPARRLLEVDMDAEVVVDRAGETYTGGLCGYLAVMRGCDLNCTFCIVPTVRGRVQSRPIPDLLQEARWMVRGGARVITLLGQTVNSYGEDVEKPGPGEARGSGRQGRPGLADLLRALQEIEGLERIRLITLHPAYVTQALAEAIRDCDKVDRFLPLPVQSGSDSVLKRMKRGYTTDLYRQRVDLLRSAVPDIELGTDWIVGFPAESDADFESSLELLGEMGFVQNYVFKYDPRPQTAAFDLPDDVPTAIKKERNQRLLARAEEVALGRMQTWIGREVRVFCESPSPRHPGSLRGHTIHNLPVSFLGPEELLGSMVSVQVQEASAFGLSGALCTQTSPQA